MSRDDIAIATGIGRDACSLEIEDMLVLKFLEVKSKQVGPDKAIKVFSIVEPLHAALLGLDT
jgi:hypothetical protein